MKDSMTMMVVLALGGFVVWQMSKKPIIPREIDGWQLQPTKIATTEQPSIPLDVWQGLTGEEIAKLPVTQQTAQVGSETYYKTSQPVAIGNTGFRIWGMTESGAVVIATRDPATYDPWEWMMS